MTTTVMKDSIIGDNWIREACQMNPVQRVLDPKTGQPNGNILTGPVRLAFTDSLFDPKKPQGRENDPTAKGKYGVMGVYPPFTVFDIMYEEYYKILGAEFASYYVAERQQYFGLEVPFHDQASKLKYAGFTPSLTYINHTTSYMPQIVDGRGNLVTDRSKVYPGVWAILAVNPYPYGKSPPQPKKGVAFGLQQIMLIADDSKLAGGAPDARVTFAGVQAVKPPVVAPAAAFGQAPGGGLPPPPVSLYPQPGYAPPPGLGALPPPPLSIVPDDDISALM